MVTRIPMPPTPYPAPTFARGGSPLYSLAGAGAVSPGQDWLSQLTGGLRDHSSALIGLGSGLLSSPTFAGGLAAGGQGWMQGNAADQAWKTPKDEKTAADPADVATYKFYSNQELKAGRNPKSFDDWYKGSKQAQKAGLGQPVYGKSKKDGHYVPFMPMSDGSYASPADPNANPADFIFDPGTKASDIAAGTGYGALQGPAQFNLPKTQQDVETELGNIDALLGNSAGLDQSFGNVGGVNIGGVGFPNQWTPTLPNTPKAGFQAQLAQVAGENFLSAYATLRGAGAITENEGQAAKEAMARLSTAQSKEDFVKALTQLKSVLAVGYQRMASQTTQGPYQSSGFTPPALGTGPAAQANAPAPGGFSVISVSP